MAVDKAHLVIRNGNSIIGSYDSAQGARQAAKALRDKHPKASYWYAKVLKAYSSIESPPTFTPVDEDIV